ERVAARYEAALGKTGVGGIPSSALTELNKKLLESERRLLSPEGLPRRPWYKHVLYAPGVYTGYGAKTMPGIREGLEQKRWAEAEAQIVRVAAVLDAESEGVEAAAELVEKASR